MSSSTVRVVGLKKTYNKGTLALDGVTFSVEKGACFGLVGPNGAGKTTTINILSGTARADYGQVEILGDIMSMDNIVLKRRVGILSEGLDLFEHLTCEEFLFFVGRIYSLRYDEIKERVNSLLHALALQPDRHRFLSEYSHGKKKKVALAAAIIHKPDILLLDEPFESIDPVSCSIIRKLIKAIQQRGGTIIITSHNLYMIERVCDRVAIMNKGKIVFESKAEDISRLVKSGVGQKFYSSLEEIFIHVVSAKDHPKDTDELKWL